MKKIMTILALCFTGMVLVGCNKEGDRIIVETDEVSISSSDTTTQTSTTCSTSTTTSTTTATTSSTLATSTTSITTSATNNATTNNATTILSTMPISSSTTTTIKETTAKATEKKNSGNVENKTPEKDINKDTVPAQEDFEETFLSAETVFNNTTTSSEMASTTITTETTTTESVPVIEIELYEAPQTAPIETQMSSIGIEKIGRFRITGYSGDTNTASGKTPKINHTIAMNNAQRKELGLSYGQEIYISGDTIEGIYVLEDCGCGRNVVDVFCSSESECYRITSYADVYIVKK